MSISECEGEDVIFPNNLRTKNDLFEIYHEDGGDSLELTAKILYEGLEEFLLKVDTEEDLEAGKRNCDRVIALWQEFARELLAVKQSASEYLEDAKDTIDKEV